MAVVKDKNSAIIYPGRVVLSVRFGKFVSDFSGLAVDHRDPVVISA